MSDSCETFAKKDMSSPELWVPHSCIHDDSEIWKAGESGYIKVLTWWAEKNGLLK